MTDHTPPDHGCTINGQPAIPIPLAEYQQLLADLAALRAVARGYCPTCGRGDAVLDQVRDVAQWLRRNYPGLTHLHTRLADALDTAPGPAATPATGGTPREHCGNLKPPFTSSTERTECVLRPGHHGSHADTQGARWWWTDEPINRPKETAMPACTATIEGPHVLGDGPITCTRDAGHPGNHVGPNPDGDGKTLWTDHNAGATPHHATSEETAR